MANEDLHVRIDAIEAKVTKIQGASLSSLAALLQLQVIVSRMRFKVNLGLDDELQQQFDELGKRLDQALQRLSEAIDVKL